MKSAKLVSKMQILGVREGQFGRKNGPRSYRTKAKNNKMIPVSGVNNPLIIKVIKKFHEASAALSEGLSSCKKSSKISNLINKVIASVILMSYKDHKWRKAQ